MRPQAFFSLVAMLSVAAFSCFAQIAPSNQNPQRRVYSISGKVNDDADEHGIDNVRVNLQSDGLVLNSVYSSDGGNFEFDGVAPGNYVIEVKLDGYEEFNATVTVSRSPVVSFSVGLTKLIAGGAVVDRTISAHQLTVSRKARDAFEKGLDLIVSKADYVDALVQLQYAIDHFPNYYEAYAMQGVAYMYLGSASSAEASLRKSIDLSSSRYPDAFFLLAGLLNNAGRFTEAETAARACVALNDSSWPAHYELAHALFLQQRSQEAEPEALRSRELNPRNPKVVLLLANIHLDLRNYTAMLQEIDDYLKLDPTGPQADQVRKDRDQVLQALQKTSAPPAADHLEQ